MTDTLIAFGGELKALDSGKVGGYLVLFGDAEHPDASAQRDYFTAETDFGPFTKSVILYDHALDPTLGAVELGEAELKRDKVGVWMEAQLKLRAEYEERFGAYLGKIGQGIKARKFGLSSGTASHLVRREPQANGVHKVLRWPLGLDASITPTPAEPRTLARAIKSLAEHKATYLGEHAERYLAYAALDRLQAIASCRVCEALADDARTLEAKLAHCRGLYDEHRDLALKAIGALLSGGDEADAEVKRIARDSMARLHAGLRLDDHSESVRDAVKGLLDRLGDLARKRAGEGRSLSEARRAALKALAGDLEALALPAPPAAAELLGLEADFLAFEARYGGLR